MNPWLLKPSSVKNHLSWLYQRTISNLPLSSLHYQWNGSNRSLLLDHTSDVQRRKLSYLSKSLRKGKLRVKFSSTKSEQHKKSLALDLQQTKQFSLIHPRSTPLTSNMRTENKDKTSSNCLVLLKNYIVLLKNYISLSEKVEIVDICQELCLGPRGFYEPTHRNGGKLGLHMMCFGRNWDPKTIYDKQYKSNGSEAPLAPPIPDKLVSLVERSFQDSQSYWSDGGPNWFPLMQPDVCVVNFYTPTGRLAAHKKDPYDSRWTKPIVSFYIGDSAEFMYGQNRYWSMDKGLLESGDVLIFYPSIYHGVESIIPNSAPLPLLNETMLRPGCLNLNFVSTLET